MKKPLVSPKTGEGDKDLHELIKFYNETLGFCPNSIWRVKDGKQESINMIRLRISCYVHKR